MWAEIDVSFDCEINNATPSILEEFFAPSDNIQTCFSQTTLSPLSTLPNSLTFGKIKQSYILLLFRENQMSTKFFIESTNNASIHDIKREVESLVKSIREFSKSKEVKLKSLSARIGLEEKLIFTGQVSTYWGRFLENVKSNVPSKIYIPASTLCATWILTSLAPNSFSNVGIKTYILGFVSSVVLAALWIFLGSIRFASLIEFSEI